MIVQISRPVTRIGCALINGIPRPAIHAIKIPMPTAANILRFIKAVRLGICILPETSGLKYAYGQKDNADGYAIFLGQRKILGQCSLLHQQ